MPNPQAAAILLAGLVLAAETGLAQPATQAIHAVERCADPCTFYRMRARGRGIDHYAREVVWACEAVAERREAGMALNDRLLAVEYALERYREALVLDRRARLAAHGLGDANRAEQEAAWWRLAEETGMLHALEAIRGGF